MTYYDTAFVEAKWAVQSCGIRGSNPSSQTYLRTQHGMSFLVYKMGIINSYPVGLLG